MIDGTTTTSSLKTFLDLPPHIRTRIYTYLICHTPLNTFTTLQQFHRNDPYQRLFRHSASIAEAKIERLIHYPSRIYLSFEGLLRTNRTIRTEIKKILKQLRKQTVNCKLDLIIERGSDGGGGVWPTWLICPARNPSIRRLEIDIRVFGDDFSVHGFGRGGPVILREFEGGALGFEHAFVGRERCRTLAFAVVAVIARFIERGARWGHVRGEVGVETLVLNFSDVGMPLALGREEREVFLESTPSTPEEKERDRFLELTPQTPTTPMPPTPPDDCACCDYWDTNSLVGEADEAITFALGDGDVRRRTRPVTAEEEDESIQAPELLRMVDLVLKPLCREEKYMLHRRKHHFSAVHLSLIRRNVRRVVIELEGRLKRRMKVVDL